MKQLFKLTLAAVLVCTACSNDRELGNSAPETSANAIGFQVIKKNVLTRGGSTTIGSGSSSSSGLEDAGHYNFGVFAYKNTDADHDIMANYLVGYFGTGKGYKLSEKQTTMTASEWAYEGLGKTEYDYAGPATGTDEYYKKTDTEYMSNEANQYLRYWDKSSSSTEFFAYAPYINGASTVTYNNTSKTMTFPAGSIKDGYNDRSKYEYMYATTKVLKAQYGSEVQLQFHRLTAKVNIKFYEDIAGYDVKMMDLGNTYTGVCAAPAQKDGSGNYSYGTLYKSAGLDINFSSTPAITWNSSGYTSYQVGQSGNVGDYLKFDKPLGDTNGKIGTTSADASESATTYYAIPKDAGGLTFHVSYQLISTTGETINVYNAKVFVPETNCKWQANYAYTYVFKITKKSSGTTENDLGIDPSDPDAKDDEQGLYPIVFDYCTVEDWTASEHEANIN